MKYCIVYLASPQESRLSTNQLRFDMLCASIRNTSRVFKNTDYYIFHEDLDNEHQDTLQSCHDSSMFFDKLDFVREDLSFVRFGRPKGYMLMCRFFSGELQEKLTSKGYDGYIRFDDDSFLLDPLLSKQSIETMMNEKDYIFRSIFMDGQPKFNNGKPMQSLYDFTKKFVSDKNLQLESIIPFLKKQYFLNLQGLYTGLCPYNNFHACNLSLWNHPIIKEYTNAIIENNGCLMHYWMDANIHSMIIFVLCPLLNINVGLNTEFGYRHNRHFSLLYSPGITYRKDEDFYPQV